MRIKDDAKRTRIIAVAAPLFAGKHFHEVTLDEVAELAKVGKGTLYTYFRDKEGLYAAVMLDLVDNLMSEIESQVASVPEPAAQLRAVALRCVEFLRSNPHVMPLFQQAETRDMLDGTTNLKESRGRCITVVSALLQSANRRGAFRVGHPDLAAAMFFGLIRAAYLYPPPGATPASLAEAVTDLFLHGVVGPARS